MKLSIVVPTYNEELYLPKLLESIKTQDFHDYEIIVSDAFSKDNTRKIAKKAGCKVVDGGLPAIGRNKGAKKAKGDLLLFLDSDVILPDKYLSKIINEFEEESLGIAITQLIPLSDKQIDKLMHDFANVYLKALEKIKPQGGGCNGILVKRSLHEKVKGFDETLDLAEDVDYIYRIAQIAKFRVITEPKLLVSTRRLDKEGRFGLAWKYSKSQLHTLLGKKLTAKDIGYEFGHKPEKKRVLYAVCGEGMGHAIRSTPIIAHLQKNSQVLIVASGRAFDLLSKKFRHVYNIQGFNIVYENNRVNNLKTFYNSIKKLPSSTRISMNLLYKMIKQFKPHMIISDFEFFSNLIAKILNIPLISIDNQHIMTKAYLDFPTKYIHEMLCSVAVTRLFIVRPKRYLVTTFFYPKVKNPKRILLFPPILRKEILKAKASAGNHVLVYQTSSSYSEMISILKSIDEQFILYGHHKEEKDGNIQYRQFNEKIFLKEFASAKAVIANGGFTLIGEALHLGKPILSVPVVKQFEQILNAIYLEKLGFGEFHEKLSKDCIESFLRRSDIYRENIRKNYKKEDNSRILKEVDSLIEKYSKRY